MEITTWGVTTWEEPPDGAGAWGRRSALPSPPAIGLDLINSWSAGLAPRGETLGRRRGGKVPSDRRSESALSVALGSWALPVGLGGCLRDPGIARPRAKDHGSAPAPAATRSAGRAGGLQEPLRRASGRSRPAKPTPQRLASFIMTPPDDAGGRCPVSTCRVPMETTSSPLSSPSSEENTSAPRRASRVGRGRSAVGFSRCA